MNPRFEQQLEVGKTWEREIADWFREAGWYVDPKCNRGGTTAPNIGGLILPDLDVFHNGQRYWIECKQKARMKVHPATGFEARLFSHYVALERESGCRWIFLGRDGQSLFGSNVERLRANVYSPAFDVQGKRHILFRYPEAFLPFSLEESPEAVLARLQSINSN